MQIFNVIKNEPLKFHCTMRVGSCPPSELPEPKYYDFIFDNKFYVFFVENGRPVMAVKVTDIEKFI